MKISFVVLTYNRSDALLAVLTSLAAQCSDDHDVVIADDGSDSGQVALLRANCPAFKCPVRHVWHPDTGFTASTARNLGAAHAAGDYLVFLDGDCIPGKNFVQSHIRLAERGFFVNGSRVLLGESLTRQVLQGHLDIVKQNFSFWWKARLAGQSNKLLHMTPWPWQAFRVQKAFVWRGIRSCNLGVWQEDFFSVNGFDETFRGWGHEDADLVLRLHHLGLRRKNGFLATEVFHLWHRENARLDETNNRQKVVQRMSENLVKAEQGLSQLRNGLPAQVTLLN
jgi:GT2 family glycosyltransferase